MTENMGRVFCKVLVFENDEEHVQTLKEIFKESHLVAFKPKNIIEALQSDADFGGIFLCQTWMESDPDYFGGTLKKIRELRADIPIFFRLNDTKVPLSQAEQTFCTLIYDKTDQEILKTNIEKYLFHWEYPSSFINGVKELTQCSLESMTKNLSIQWDMPYLLKDHGSNADMQSIIYLESTWCRGYMMLQANKQDLIALIKNQNTYQSAEDISNKSVNSFLSEMTNTIWGEFRIRFIPEEEMQVDTFSKTEIPIIVNYKEDYTSFGAGMNQLCIQYQLKDTAGAIAPVIVHQKFIFNLAWKPEKFVEPPEVFDELLEQGSIEEW